MSIPRTDGAAVTPGGLDCALRTTHSTATSLSPPSGARRPEDLGLEASTASSAIRSALK